MISEKGLCKILRSAYKQGGYTILPQTLREDCLEGCPPQEHRDNPGWWLGLEAGICMLTKKGEKIGWYSQYKKEDLVNKLGPIEHEAEEILEQICEKRCAFRRPPLLPESQEDMDAICGDCPMNRLEQLIGV